VVMAASDFGITGYEDRDTVDADTALKARVEAIRLAAGPLMNLGDVTGKSVPKMMLVARPREGGTICVRSLIPHRVHASIGVLGAVSVATACLFAGSPAAAVAQVPKGASKVIGVEHPTGVTECVVMVDAVGQPVEAGMLRTARKLMDGVVFA
jgi:4-oxalomesaconate tautomerase